MPLHSRRRLPLPRTRDLRARVTVQPKGFGSVAQQAEANGRFLASVSRQLRANKVAIDGVALIKAGVANNIFKSAAADPELKRRGVDVKPERVAKAYFRQYPLIERMMSRHSRMLRSADYINKWSLEERILYLSGIVSRSESRVMEQHGRRYRVWSRRFVSVDEAINELEKKTAQMTPERRTHYEVMRRVFTQVERELAQAGVDWEKARRVKVPDFIEEI